MANRSASMRLASSSSEEFISYLGLSALNVCETVWSACTPFPFLIQLAVPLFKSVDGSKILDLEFS